MQLRSADERDVMIIEQRVHNAEPKLDLLDKWNPRETVGGWAAICRSEVPARNGWRGPLYLHEKESLYAGGAAWFNAALDAWQHDMTEHPRYLVEPTWEEIIAGDGSTVDEPLVPYRGSNPILKGFLDFFRAVKENLGW